LAHREIIERQARDDVIVNACADQLLHRRMNEVDAIAQRVAIPFSLQAFPQHFDEMAVDLDRVEMVAWPQVAQDFLGHRPGAGTDFENTAGAARAAELRNQGSCQKPTARQNRSGVTKMSPAFAEESSALRPVAHPGVLV